MINNCKYDYSTHLPLLRAVMDNIKPAFVLELGTGIHSTPVLSKGNYLGIENDLEWMAEVNKACQAKIIHQPTDIDISTPLRALTEAQQKEITDYYNSLVIPDVLPRFLFVDNYTGFRTLAINALKEKFDFVSYHDCEPAGIAWYDYDRLDKRGYYSYYICSPTSWTCLMSRKAVELTMDNYIKEYLKEWPACNYLTYVT